MNEDALVLTIRVSTDNNIPIQREALEASLAVGLPLGHKVEVIAVTEHGPMKRGQGA